MHWHDVAMLPVLSSPPQVELGPGLRADGGRSRHVRNLRCGPRARCGRWCDHGERGQRRLGVFARGCVVPAAWLDA